jgi:hypothetical protein
VSSRKVNTARSYETKQRLFQTFCQNKGYPDGDTVTSGKLGVFITDAVLLRPAKRRTNRAPVASTSSNQLVPDAGSESDEEYNGRPTSMDQTISDRTVCAYVAAVVDLYRQQVANGVNNHPHPRDSDIKAMLETLRINSYKHKRNQNIDRGIGTMLDGYVSLEQFKGISKHFFNKNGGVDVRNRAMFLVSHFGLMRGDNIRKLELADMFSINFENEGVTPCLALVLVLSHGKTNRFYKIEYAPMIRNKHVEICPIGSLALWFFERFHIQDEPPPNLTSNDLWFPIKSFPSSASSEEISYSTHRKAVSEAFTKIGLNSHAKTQACRRSGAQMAELGGVEESQVRRLGRWADGTMENVYLSRFPRDGIRIMAGFEKQGILLCVLLVVLFTRPISSPTGKP